MCTTDWLPVCVRVRHCWHSGLQDGTKCFPFYFKEIYLGKNKMAFIRPPVSSASGQVMLCALVTSWEESPRAEGTTLSSSRREAMCPQGHCPQGRPWKNKPQSSQTAVTPLCNPGRVGN